MSPAVMTGDRGEEYPGRCRRVDASTLITMVAVELFVILCLIVGKILVMKAEAIDEAEKDN